MQAEEDGSKSDVIEEPHKLVPDGKSNDAPSNLDKNERRRVTPEGGFGPRPTSQGTSSVSQLAPLMRISRRTCSHARLEVCHSRLPQALFSPDSSLWASEKGPLPNLPAAYLDQQQQKSQGSLRGWPNQLYHQINESHVTALHIFTIFVHTLMYVDDVETLRNLGRHICCWCLSREKERTGLSPGPSLLAQPSSAESFQLGPELTLPQELAQRPVPLP